MKSGTHNSTTTPFAKRRLRVPGACVSMANAANPKARIVDAAQSDPVSLRARVFCGGVRLYAARRALLPSRIIYPQYLRSTRSRCRPGGAGLSLGSWPSVNARVFP